MQASFISREFQFRSKLKDIWAVWSFFSNLLKLVLRCIFQYPHQLFESAVLDQIFPVKGFACYWKLSSMNLQGSVRKTLSVLSSTLGVCLQTILSGKDNQTLAGFPVLQKGSLVLQTNLPWMVRTISRLLLSPLKYIDGFIALYANIMFTMEIS